MVKTALYVGVACGLFVIAALSVIIYYFRKWLISRQKAKQHLDTYNTWQNRSNNSINNANSNANNNSNLNTSPNLPRIVPTRPAPSTPESAPRAIHSRPAPELPIKDRQEQEPTAPPSHILTMNRNRGFEDRLPSYESAMRSGIRY